MNLVRTRDPFWPEPGDVPLCIVLALVDLGIFGALALSVWLR